MTDKLSDTTIRALAERLGPALGGRLRRDEPLGQYTTFRIGGPADAFVEVESADELADAVLVARAMHVPYFVLGLGANILVGDKGYRGLVIRNHARHFRFGSGLGARDSVVEHPPTTESRAPSPGVPSPDQTVFLWSESGAVMQDMILEAVERGLSGIEHYIGIPSTVGGAIWQNLHFLSPAPERERTMFIAEVFESCEILSAEGERRTVGADYVQFGYDDTVFHHRADIVLAATFRLTPGDPDRLHRILHENLSWRGARHPWLSVHPSAGSIFKKIEGVGAGRLIDQAGLKGHRHKGAQISPMHANIIVNNGHATAADVRELIALAQGAVAERFGLRLETEIGMIGEF